MASLIEPAELSFQRPFTIEVSRTLTIKNPNTTPIAFKVKTTAPKQYCVRPNSGRIEPGHDVEVTVLLQAMKVEPPADTKCRDKFLVQSALITSDKEFAPIQSVLENTDKSLMQEKKIRVIWLTAADDRTSGAMGTPLKQTHLNGEGGDMDGTPDVSRAYGSPGGDDTGTTATAPPPYTEDVKASPDGKLGEEKEAGSGSTAAPPAAAAKSAMAQARDKIVQTTQMTAEELRAELDRARAEVVALKQQGTVRLRKAAGGDPNQPVTTGQVATAMKQSVEGVPVHVVAMLCFATFLLAYLFF